MLAIIQRSFPCWPRTQGTNSREQDTHGSNSAWGPVWLGRRELQVGHFISRVVIYLEVPIGRGGRLVDHPTQLICIWSKFWIFILDIYLLEKRQACQGNLLGGQRTCVRWVGVSFQPSQVRKGIDKFATCQLRKAFPSKEGVSSKL